MLLIRIVLVIAIALLSIELNAQPTWSSDVATIVYSKCTPCHRTGEIAPFTLQSYAEAKAAAYSMKAMVSAEVMPPWPPAKGHGDFLGDRSLSNNQKQTIINWVDAGAPHGDPNQEPAPPTFPTGSQLGTPDLVLEMSEEWKVEGDYTDRYRFFVLPSGLLEDKDIAAIEFRPGNAKVVHHVLFFVDTTGVARAKDAADPLPGYSGFGDPGFESAGSYLGWVPGAQQRFFPEGVGMRLYKGADLVIQIHYAPSSTEEVDKSHLNIFYQKNNDVRLIQQFVLSPNDLVSGAFVIPANAVKKFTTRYTIPLDVSIVAVAPHMHLLGQNCRAYAVTPSDDTINLIMINDWEFHWQGGYTYRHPIKIPRNSRLYYEAEYDNTTSNHENPNNPPKLVSWGESTTDEMLLCYFFWLPYQFGDENMVMETPTGVDDREIGDRDIGDRLIGEFSVVPSPTSDYAEVVFVSQASGEATVCIYDVTGNLMSTPQSSSFKLNTSSLSSGTYRVVVKKNNEVSSAPLVVVR